MESGTKNKPGRGAMLFLLLVALGVAAATLLGGRKADTPVAGPVPDSRPEGAPADQAGRGAAGSIAGAAATEASKAAAASDATGQTEANPRTVAGSIEGVSASASTVSAGSASDGSGAAATTPAPASDKAAAPAAGSVKPAESELKLDTEFASAKRIVPFAFNRVGVGPVGSLAVKELLPLAKQADRVYVRGRTDSRGKTEANRQVALNRAYAVRTAFVRGGVEAAKLRISYCTSCFIADNTTEEGRRANRRVDVELIMPAEEIAKLPKAVHAREYPGGNEGRLTLAPAMGAPAAQAAAR